LSTLLKTLLAPTVAGSKDANDAEFMQSVIPSCLIAILTEPGSDAAWMPLRLTWVHPAIFVERIAVAS
jgi:hypothetical protein